MTPRLSRPALAILTMAACLLYYLALACFPQAFAGRLFGIPLSIALALALLALFCLITLLYAEQGCEPEQP